MGPTLYHRLVLPADANHHGTLFFLGLVLYVPFLRDLFHFSTLHPGDLALCLASGLVSILWFEGLKMVRRQQKAPHAEATAGGSA